MNVNESYWVSTVVNTELSSSSGQKFAMMELKVILASLLLNFDIESTQTPAELKPNPGMILQPTHGIKVKLTSRK